MKTVARVSFGLFFFASLPAMAYTFGYPGSNGIRGSDGINGRNGQSTSVVAEGQSERFDLRGGDGSDGTSGQNGTPAGACNFYPGDYNQFGAPGGSGGDAGAGGRGGNGGDLTVYAADLSFLNKIFVDAQGGRFGDSGRPGWGAPGCYCPLFNWSRTRCAPRGGGRGGFARECWNTTYWCYSGSPGQNGLQAPQWGGHLGSLGRLTVIPQRERLPEERTSVVLLTEQAVAQIQEFSRHQWTQRSGALRLLAPGSQIQDTYSFFTGMEQARYQLIWKARRPLAEFGKEIMQLNWNGASAVVADWANLDLWLDVQRKTLDSHMIQDTVTRAMQKSDSQILGLTVRGRGVLLTAEVEDLVRVSDLLTTGFHLRLEHDVWWGYKKLFDGPLPESAIRKPTFAVDPVTQPQVFTLDLGHLPGVQLSEIKAGEKIRVTLTVDRVFSAAQRAQQILTVSQQVGWD